MFSFSVYVIMSFASLVLFVVSFACRNLVAYPKGYGDKVNTHFSLFLQVADSESLPNGWKRHIKFRLTVANQISEKLSKQRGDFFTFARLFF